MSQPMVLRTYQETARQAAWDFLRARDGNPALVLPTGAGKSPLMAALAREAVEKWNGRVCILAHVQELVAQNADKLRQLWPGAPVGLYAAGLRRRDRFDPVIVAQIQSVARRAQELGRFDLLLIDEAHRVPLSGDGLYLRFIEEARGLNPELRVIGLTATPYRLQGRAVPVCGPGRVLTEIAYEARVPDLIADGFLSRLVSRAPDKPNLEGVHTRGGEYVEAELGSVMSEPELVRRTVADMLERAQDRRSGIVFCVNVDHAEKVLSELRKHGQAAGLIHAGTPKAEREQAIARFQAGGLRWLVNINVLSEGFDAPAIDIVAMLRPTKSPGMYYQQVGRGLRLAPGKQDCLVLDYAGNIVEHGPIDEIRVSKERSGERKVLSGQAKECVCGVMLPLGARLCPECGHQFGGSGPGHDAVPTGLAVVSSERERQINEYLVSRVEYKRHEKPGKPASLRVIYQCGLRRFSEWVCPEHGGFARAKAERWWMGRGGGVLPGSLNEALDRAYGLRAPERITVDETTKYAQVIGVTLRAEPAGEPAARDPELDKRAPEWLRRAIGGN